MIWYLICLDLVINFKFEACPRKLTRQTLQQTKSHECTGLDIVGQEFVYFQGDGSIRLNVRVDIVNILENKL
jgi:hypothetical protein